MATEDNSFHSGVRIKEEPVGLSVVVKVESLNDSEFEDENAGITLSAEVGQFIVENEIDSTLNIVERMSNCDEPRVKKVKLESVLEDSDKFLLQFEEVEVKDEIEVGPTVVHRPSNSQSNEDGAKRKKTASYCNGTAENTCKLCDYKAKTKQTMKRHMQTHSLKESFSGNICPEISPKIVKRRSKTESGINGSDPNLKNAVSNNIKPYSCNICSYKTSHKSTLTVHIRNHTGEKPYSCKLCPYRCKQISHLQVHNYIHTNKPFSCELCSYACAQKSDLGRHMVKHQKFNCDKCSQQFSDVNDLKKHVMIIHYSIGYLFYCNDCSFVTSKKQSLILHMRTHSYKSHQCKICPSRFVQKCHLNRHISSVHSIKMHFCNTCPYRTARRDCLIRHMLIHSNKKPYSCDLCSYAAKKHALLKIHIFKHHNN